MPSKVSRHQWPTDKKLRLAMIAANLRIRVPPGKGKGPKKGRPRKDDEEIELDELMEEGKEL